MFGKKKKSQGMDDLAAVIGNDSEPKKQSRKEAKEAQKKKFDVETQKDSIIDLLKKCYTKVNTTRYYDESNRIMDLMSNLKSGTVDKNARAVYALDGLIKKCAAELEVYCNQGNYYGITTTIDAMDTLVNQRGYITHKYYEDPEYLKVKIELMKLKINRENITEEIRKDIDSFNKLKESAQGESDARRIQIQRQMLQIKEDKEGKQRQTDALDTQIRNLTILVNQKEQNKDVYLPDEIVDEFGTVLEETKMADIQMGQASAAADKIAGANKTVMNQGMTVSDADSAESIPSQVNIEDMTI